MGDSTNQLSKNNNSLIIKSIGIDTYRENIIFIREDSHICKSEGFSALKRIIVKHHDQTIVATLNVVYSDLLTLEEAGLSKEAMERLSVVEGDTIQIFHMKHIESFAKVRAKMYGKELSASDFKEIINDIASGQYSNIELASFITTCSGDHMTVDETISLTQAMIDTSEKISWDGAMIIDKHSVGGLPGNRTTPILVSIVAAAGLIIPKTSSRAITSPAGTADTIETFTEVDLSIEQIKHVVEKEGGCMVWGGAVKLSPADDVLISVERALDIDSAGQMVASLLSKKKAAGSTHVLIDIPVGESAKVRSQQAALKLQYYFKAVAEKIGLKVKIAITDGSQPVGRGIGPTLEALDVISVLKNDADCPEDLKFKSVRMAGIMLEMSGKFEKGKGYSAALDILESGKAYQKFIAICKAQGGYKEPAFAAHIHHVLAERSGTVKFINNRKLARVAKLAGAPKAVSAGIWFDAPLGKQVKAGDTLFIVYSETNGELDYVKEYLSNNKQMIVIE